MPLLTTLDSRCSRQTPAKPTLLPVPRQAVRVPTSFSLPPLKKELRLFSFLLHLGLRSLLNLTYGMDTFTSTCPTIYSIPVNNTAVHLLTQSNQSTIPFSVNSFLCNRYHSYVIKFKLSKHTFSDFSILTTLRNNHRYLIPEHFRRPKKKPCA